MVKDIRSTIKFTYEDYKNAPNDKRYELLEGELIVVPSPKTYHQRISGNLSFKLRDFVLQRELGEVFDAPYDVVLSEETVLQPDILFVSKERSHIITEDNIQGAPDLVIEILIFATQDRDRTWKRSIYAKYGVDEYWLVDPDKKTIQVLELGKKGYQQFKIFQTDQILESPLLTSLGINLEEVF